MLAYECRRVWSRVITWRYWRNASTSACCRRSVTRSTSGWPTSHVNSWDMSTSWQSIQPTLSKTLSPSGGACSLLLSSRDSHVRWQRNITPQRCLTLESQVLSSVKMYLLWTPRRKRKQVNRWRVYIELRFDGIMRCHSTIVFKPCSTKLQQLCKCIVWIDLLLMLSITLLTYCWRQRVEDILLMPLYGLPGIHLYITPNKTSGCTVYM